jgi:hypothetical protein
MAVAENDFASFADLVAVSCIERFSVERSGKIQPSQSVLLRDAFNLSNYR